jgi:hypothetical protein
MYFALPFDPVCDAPDDFGTSCHHTDGDRWILKRHLLSVEVPVYFFHVVKGLQRHTHEGTCDEGLLAC